MALPKLTTPTYELEIPSTDEKIKYRPFLVREEKILMMAMESKKNADIVQAVKDIVSECTFNKVNMSDLPMFDVEYIFLQIRSKSVGEVSKLTHGNTQNVSCGNFTSILLVLVSRLICFLFVWYPVDWSFAKTCLVDVSCLYCPYTVMHFQNPLLLCLVYPTVATILGASRTLL